MIRISVTSTEVRNQSGIAKTSGKQYSLNFQTVWFHLCDRHGVADPYPTKVEIILEKDASGAALFNAPGDYQLSPSSIYVDQNGKLAISARLIALHRASVAKAA